LSRVFVINRSPTIRENHPPLAIKGTSTLLPGHAEALLSWKKLAGDKALGVLIVADLDRSFSFKEIFPCVLCVSNETHPKPGPAAIPTERRIRRLIGLSEGKKTQAGSLIIS